MQLEGERRQQLVAGVHDEGLDVGSLLVFPAHLNVALEVLGPLSAARQDLEKGLQVEGLCQVVENLRVQ